MGEGCLTKGEKLVDGSGGLRGPVRTATEDGLLCGKSYGRGRARVTLLVVERDGLEPVTDKRSEWRTIVNDYVDPIIFASGIHPWVDLVEQMISEGQTLVGSRFEEAGKREHDAGCKERDQQNDRTWQSEPPRRQTGKEQYEEFIARDGQPVDEDVQSVGGGVPFGYDEDAVKDDHGDRRSDEKESQSRGDARPEGPQKKHCYRQ